MNNPVTTTEDQNGSGLDKCEDLLACCQQLREQADELKKLNIELERRLAEQTAELERVERLSSGQWVAIKEALVSLSAESEPKNLLEHVLRTFKCQLHADVVSMWEINENIGRLDPVATYGVDGIHILPPEEVVNTEGSKENDESITNWQDHPVWGKYFTGTVPYVIGKVINGKVGVRLPGEDNWYDWMADIIANPLAIKIASQMVEMHTLNVPMLVDKKVIGHVAICFSTHRDFRCDEIDLARALAQQATLAWRFIRLGQQSKKAAILAERNRIAREIHDTFAQGFTGVITQLQAARGATLRGALVDASVHIERAENLARGNLGEARRSVRALRPRLLLIETLVVALKKELAASSEHSGLLVDFKIKGEQRAIPPDWEDGLLRITKESLTNTIRYAKARNFLVVLKYEEQGVHLSFTDDGQGFDITKESEGYGLLGMKERVAQMGGEIVIQSQPGHGTQIHIILKYSVISNSLRDKYAT